MLKKNLNENKNVNIVKKLVVFYLLYFAFSLVWFLLSRVFFWGEEFEFLEIEICIYLNYFLGSLYLSKDR